METKTLNRKNQKVEEFYQKSLGKFRAQYTDVVSLTHIYVDANSKVCGGLWIDSKGVHNASAQYKTDAVKEVIFK